MNTTPQRIVFESLGELSKDIMATAVVANLKKKYPELPIIVSTLNPEVWLHNPDVFRVYKLGLAPYFYDNYIADGRALIFKLDPYNDQGFLLEGRHLIDVWCELCGVPRGKTRPKLFFTAREKEVAKKMVASTRPIFLIQVNGEIGGLPYPTPWSRDFNFAQAEEIATTMFDKGYDVMQIAPKQDKVIKGARPLVLENRLLMAVLPYTEKRLLVDSFPHQAATALGLPSVILWNTLSAKRHGDPMHKNIAAEETAYAIELREVYIDQFRIFKTPTPGMPAIEPLSLHRTADIIDALLKK